MGHFSVRQFLILFVAALITTKLFSFESAISMLVIVIMIEVMYCALFMVIKPFLGNLAGLEKLLPRYDNFDQKIAMIYIVMQIAFAVLIMLFINYSWSAIEVFVPILVAVAIVMCLFSWLISMVEEEAKEDLGKSRNGKIKQ